VRRNRRKNSLIGMLFAAVLFMAIGYAAFTAELQINATANVFSDWEVVFNDNFTEAATGSASTATAEITDEGLTFNVTVDLLAPGDSMQYELTVVNNSGRLSALYDEVATLAGETVVSSSGTGNLTWDFDDADLIGTPIAPGASRTVTLTVTWSNNETVTNAILAAIEADQDGEYSETYSITLFFDSVA
jgi:hypothetical protein